MSHDKVKADAAQEAQKLKKLATQAGENFGIKNKGAGMNLKVRVTHGPKPYRRRER